MPTKRLVLAQPLTDSDGVEFPFVDVRLSFAGTFGQTKAGAFEEDGYWISPFTAAMEISFYRLASGNRIFLAKDYRPERLLFEAKERIKDPTITSERIAIQTFWSYIYIYSTESVASFYSVNMDNLRYQIGAENSFEALTIDYDPPFVPFIDCLAVLLRREGGPDFAGLTVVEDVA